MTKPIQITVYRWAGSFGPFKVNIPCGECTLTMDIINDTLMTELADIPIDIKVKDWLSNWWEALYFGAWHAPIVLVENKMVSQGEALNRGLLVQAVINKWAERDTLQGSIVYGKENCPYCIKAKKVLSEADINFQYHDVVKDSSALYRMIPEVKAVIGSKTPITVPQIWLSGEYIGGYSDLEQWLTNHGSPQNIIGNNVHSITGK